MAEHVVHQTFRRYVLQKHMCVLLTMQRKCATGAKIRLQWENLHLIRYLLATLCVFI